MSHVSHDGGSHAIYLALDRHPFVLLATMEADHDPIPTGEARAQEFEIRLQLDRSPADPAMGPIIRSWGLRSQPATLPTEQIVVPFLIGPVIQRKDGLAEPVDSFAQVENIKTLARTKEVAQFTMGARAASVIVVDWDLDIKEVFLAFDEQLGLTGICLTRLKVVT
jgi:hypothetical protein